jgi:hypothetical protein
MSDKRKPGIEKGADTFENKEKKGEGSYSGSKQYDEEAEKFRKSGKVDDAAKKAESSFDSSEGSELRNAEREGKSRAKEEDPLLRENREPPETKR